MKKGLSQEKLGKLAEMIRERLRKELGREPTQKELLKKLPVIVCTPNKRLKK
jgi:hypothetical protein